MEARASGEGQVVDVAMVDGSALLMAVQYGLRALGQWSDERGTNLLDSGAPFYEVYETADGHSVSVGALEPQFYADFIARLGPEAADLPPQHDVGRWPEAKKRMAEIFASRTRAEWCELLDAPDTCFAPVLSMAEAHLDPHLQARGTYITVDGVLQPGPAPRFSRTPATRSPRPTTPGAHTDELLAGLGMGTDEIAALRESGAVA
jgi:alpha-methylacyl-CoA racemase